MSQNQMKNGDIENKDIENCFRAYFLTFPQFDASLLPTAINILGGNYNSLQVIGDSKFLQSVMMPAINDYSEASIRLKKNSKSFTMLIKLGPTPYSKRQSDTIDDEFICLIGIQKFFKTRDSSKVQ